MATTESPLLQKPPRRANPLLLPASPLTALSSDYSSPGAMERQARRFVMAKNAEGGVSSAGSRLYDALNPQQALYDPNVPMPPGKPLLPASAQSQSIAAPDDVFSQAAAHAVAAGLPPAETGPASRPGFIPGYAAGQAFDGDTSVTTHPETRTYLQRADGGVARADGKPMGGSFALLGSVEDPQTGRKVTQGFDGGAFTYDGAGRLLDYSSPLTQEADAKARAAGYADRHAYLSRPQQGTAGGGGSATGGAGQSLLAGLDPELVRMATQRITGSTDLAEVGNIKARRRLAAALLGEGVANQQRQRELESNAALHRSQLASETAKSLAQYGLERDKLAEASDNNQTRNQIDWAKVVAEQGNRLQFDEPSAAFMQRLASSDDPRKTYAEGIKGYLGYYAQAGMQPPAGFLAFAQKHFGKPNSALDFESLQTVAQ